MKLAALFLASGLGGVAPALAASETWQEPTTGMRFIHIPKGCYRMGTPKAIGTSKTDQWRYLGYTTNLAEDESPAHEVCLDAFWLGAHEVTADEWQKVTGKPPPSGKGRAPAAGITWLAARSFARKLSELVSDGAIFRLPTEAEWEYACRANEKKEKPPHQSDNLEVAWYNLTRPRITEPAPVGQRKANAWGLHDMLGNVWEWVEDAYSPTAYALHSLFNPLMTAGQESARVIRGGSFRSEHFHVRCSSRGAYANDAALGQIGLRLVRGPLPASRRER